MVSLFGNRVQAAFTIIDKQLNAYIMIITYDRSYVIYIWKSELNYELKTWVKWNVLRRSCIKFGHLACLRQPSLYIALQLMFEYAKEASAMLLHYPSFLTPWLSYYTHRIWTFKHWTKFFKLNWDKNFQHIKVMKVVSLITFISQKLVCRKWRLSRKLKKNII